MSKTVTENITYPLMNLPWNRHYITGYLGIGTLHSFLNTPRISMGDLFSNPIDYVTSIRAYPFNVHTQLSLSDSQTSRVDIGLTTMTTLTCYQMNIWKPTLNLGSMSIGRHFNDFRDYAPYTKITAYIPYCDFVELPVNEIMGKTVKFRMIVDIDTGRCVCDVICSNGIDTTQDYILMSVNGTIGLDIPIGASNYREATNKILKSSFASAGQVVSTGASGGFKATKKQSTGERALGTGTNIINSSINDIMSTQISVSRGSVGDGYVNFAQPQNVYLIYERVNSPTITNYNKYNGRPLMANRTISTLSGYTEIDTIHLENLQYATSDEVSEIENLLKSGVIF